VARVSVIIPAYDSAAVIGRALESVRAQTYTDVEVLVADDASADDTADRAEATGVPARVVRAERNGGPAAARNLALRHATGELVAFLDADDEWLPPFLERLVARYDAERAASGAPVGIVACDARIAGSDETYLEQAERVQHLAVEPLTLERVLRRNCVYIAALVPRAAGEEVGWFAEELFGTEDHDLWLRILETGRRAVVEREVLAVYHQPSGSISSNLPRMGENNRRTYERALERGRLDARLERVARRELRYNRALQAVAAARFDRRPGSLLRALPSAAFVAATRPEHWRDWARALRP
jgi:glycosyltransferase involved in cell wall biosynthesis